MNDFQHLESILRALILRTPEDALQQVRQDLSGDARDLFDAMVLQYRTATP